MTKHDSQRRRMRFQVVREWRSGGRFDFTDAELAAEVEQRQKALREKHEAAGQGQLPLMDVGQVASQTKRDACRASRSQRISRRQSILSMLENAGANGLTREEIANALAVKEGYVSSPVLYLLSTGDACECGTRVSKAGRLVAVVVLAKFAAAGAHA